MGLLIHRGFHRGEMGRRAKGTDVIGLNEAAELLRVHRHTLSAAVRRGEVPAAKIGRVYTFSRSGLLEMVRTGRAPKPEPEEAA